MAVREKYGLDFVLVFEQVGNVWNDNIDAQQFLIREHDAGVNDDDGPIGPKRHHVHAEFTESAKGNDFECHDLN